MEAFYDSDEDVCWGPITLREVKRDLRKPASYTSHIDRRRTIGFNTPPKQVIQQEETVIEDMEDLIDDVSKISIQSQYFTPNETMKSDFNFVDKVSHILNDSNYDSKYTSFVTATDEIAQPLNEEFVSEEFKSTTNSPFKNKKSFYPNSSPNTVIPNNTLDKHSESKLYNITNIAKFVRPSCLIDNFQATLLDSSESSDEDFHQTLGNIIEKLEEDDEHMKDDNLHTSYRQKNVEGVRYQGMQEKYDDISEVYDSSLNIDESFKESNQDLSSSYVTKEINNSMKEIKDSSDYNLYHAKDESVVFYEDEDISAASAVVKEFDYSFNDTLEEMERALQMGLDYSMSSTKEPKQNDVIDNETHSKNQHDSQLGHATHLNSQLYHVDSLYHKPEPHKHNIYHSSNTPKYFKRPMEKSKSASKAKPSPCNSKQHDTKLRTPNHKFNNIMSPVSAYINSSPKDVKTSSTFKIPMKVATKSPLPTYNQRNALSFKAIQSPVAVYIKNAPTVPLQQNVQKLELPRFLPKHLLSPGKNRKLAKENCSLPEVMYRPAKKLFTKQETRKLPGYIEKLIPNKTEIVRHEGRIHKDKGIKPYNQLIDQDLTMMANSSLLGCSSQDISVLTSKQATIE